MIKLPKVFLPGNKNLEEKTKELAESSHKKEQHINDLEFLKSGRTKKEKEDFLKIFAEHLPDFVEKAREKMKRTGTNTLYLDDPQDYQIRDYGYRTKIGIGRDGNLYFLYSLSGMTYKANLDDKEFYKYNGYAPVYDHLNTYPDKDTVYDFYGPNFLGTCFKIGKEMYESIKSFLEK